MRWELLQQPLSFGNAMDGSMQMNDLKFGIYMIVLDMFLYIIAGYIFERFMDNEFKFHTVPVKDMDATVGASLVDATKSYGAVKPAIKNVSVVFRRDYITCLLGRNGAGKSTIINLLTGQFRPTSGAVYLPQNVHAITGDEHKERVGLCPQADVLIPNLTANEHLQLYASIKMTNGRRTEVERIMESLDFGKYVEFKSQFLSGGFKRRLNIGIAFIGKFYL